MVKLKQLYEAPEVKVVIMESNPSSLIATSNPGGDLDDLEEDTEGLIYVGKQ